MIACLAQCLVAAAGCGQALAGTGDGAAVALAQLGVERWDRSTGLASPWVRDIVEGSDGAIWIATARGLSRFDGRGFRTLDASNTPELPHSAITALAVDRHGTLWIGLEYGGIRILDREGVRAPAGSASLPSSLAVVDLRLDAAGTLWIGSSDGLWRLRDGVAELVVLGPGPDDARIRALARTADDVLWVRTAQHGLWRRSDDGWTRLEDPPGCGSGSGLAVGADGSIYTSCLEGVWRRKGGSRRWQQISAEIGVGPLFLDRDGRLWFGTREGLVRWHNDAAERRAPALGLNDWRVRAFHEDSRGDLWIGTFSGGLSRLLRGAVHAYGPNDTLPLNSATAVVEDGRGGMWIGGFGQGLVRWHPDRGVDGRWTRGDGLPGDSPWALARHPDRTDGVWVGGELGLAWVQDGASPAPPPAALVHGDAATVLFADPARPGTLWLDHPAGGAVEVGPTGRRRYGLEQGLELRSVAFFLTDAAGQLLAGGEEGLFRLDQGRWSPVLVDGLPMRALTAATLGSDGALWLASSERGLVRIDAAGFHAWTLAEGLPLYPVHSVALDGRGGLWLSGNEGLARIRLDDHERWRQGQLARLPVERLGARDGLRDPECNGWGSPAMTQLTDGTLAYPTTGGLALVEPARLPAVTLAPERVGIAAARSGDRPLQPTGKLVLSDRERSLHIAFSAIELVRPEAVAFRYRLDPLDSDWIDAGGTSEAVYAALAPGTYQLRLQARLPGQDWVEAAQATTVEVQPRWWEIAWLRVLAGALALAASIAGVLWRLRIERRHSARLRRARTELLEVVDTSPNPIFARRRDGTYALANRAAAAIYGLAPAELEGRSPAQLDRRLPGMDRVDAMDAEVIATGSEQTLPEARIVDHAGNVHWYRIVKRPGLGADGFTVEQVIGTAVDVTDFKQAELGMRSGERRLRASREQARGLSRKLLRAQEDERRRLAQELHDDLTQRLAGLAMLAWGTLQAAERDASVDSTGNLAELAGELERLSTQIQTMSRDLHPPALGDLGLAAALQAECDTFAKRVGLPVGFSWHGDAEPPPEVGLALYRIVQEALRNCRAHAGGTHARVHLEAGVEGWSLEITDDGVGFDAAVDPPHPGHGLGLSSMRERARLAGGALHLHSAPGKGTRIIIRVPAPMPVDTAPGTA